MRAKASTGFFGDPGDRITASDRDELLGRLSKVDLHMPTKAEGRNTHHRERRCVVLYLRTLARERRLDHPISVWKLDQQSEPPDFMILTGARGRSIALEVTDAGTERFQRAVAEWERSPPGTQLVDEDTLVLPGKEPSEPGWIGDEAERQWASILLDHVQRKTATLARFRPADEYQLLLYDYVHAVPEDVAVAAAFLVSKLSKWEATAGRRERHFSVISVLQDARLFYDVRGERAVFMMDHST